MRKKEMFQNIGQRVQYPFNIYYNHSPETFPLHWHNYVELILSYQQGVQYEIGGRIYTLAPGDMLFIWSGELHALLHQPQPCRVLMLQFDYSILGDRRDFRDRLCLFHRIHKVESARNPALAASLCKRLEAVRALYDGADDFKEVKMCIELYRLFMTLGQSLPEASLLPLTEHKQKSSQITERMISVCAYLSNHCTENISLAAAARQAGFSQSHFSRLFKEFTAESYTGFITRERLHKAEELLTNSSLSVTDAAFGAGFNSISTFNRIFKQVKKCSPTQFRDLFRASHTVREGVPL